MVFQTSFELLVFQLLFHLSWIYKYKNVNPDSSVLCFALRSGQTECTSIRDSPLELELRLEIQLSIQLSDIQLIPVMYSDIVFDYCIRDICCTLFNSDMYIVASRTTIFCFRCIYYSVFVICDYFIYC